MKELKNYTSFQELTNDLVYMNKTNDVYSISLGTTKVRIQMLYSDTKKYCYYFDIQDKEVLKKIAKTKFLLKKEKLSNKAAFLNSLKKSIDVIIPILQQSNYKLSFSPEIALFDLENISQEYGLNELDLSDNDYDDNRILVNKVMLYHNILPQNITKSPYEKDGIYIVEINSLSIKQALLFPQEDKYFKNIDLSCNGSPNLYFPGVLTIQVSKYLEYRGIRVKILFESLSPIQNYAKIAQQYYSYYKENKIEGVLSFSMKILSIIKNPYTSENFGELTPEDAISMSQCPKCNSSSSMFKIHMSQVDVSTSISGVDACIIKPENILEYKDILKIECDECSNNILEEKAFMQKIIDKRGSLKVEDWENPETGIPLLDSQEPREVILKYDMIELEVEFDTTNPFQPKPILSDIIKTGSVI